MCATTWPWPIPAWGTWTAPGRTWRSSCAKARWTCTAAATSPCSCSPRGGGEEAVEAVRKLRLDRIEEVDELFKYCLALADLDLDQELSQALKKIFLTSPYDPSMLYLCGVCQYNQGRVQESLRILRKARPDRSGQPARPERRAHGGRWPFAGKRLLKRLPYTFDFPGRGGARGRRAGRPPAAHGARGRGKGPAGRGRRRARARGPDRAATTR